MSKKAIETLRENGYNVERYLTGHMYLNSPYETDDSCGNCNGAMCDDCEAMFKIIKNDEVIDRVSYKRLDAYVNDTITVKESPFYKFTIEKYKFICNQEPKTIKDIYTNSDIELYGVAYCKNGSVAALLNKDKYLLHEIHVNNEGFYINSNDSALNTKYINNDSLNYFVFMNILEEYKIF